MSVVHAVIDLIVALCVVFFLNPLFWIVVVGTAIMWALDALINGTRNEITRIRQRRADRPSRPAPVRGARGKARTIAGAAGRKARTAWTYIRGKTRRTRQPRAAPVRPPARTPQPGSGGPVGRVIIAGVRGLGKGWRAGRNARKAGARRPVRAWVVCDPPGGGGCGEPIRPPVAAVEPPHEHIAIVPIPGPESAGSNGGGPGPGSPAPPAPQPVPAIVASNTPAITGGNVPKPSSPYLPARHGGTPAVHAAPTATHVDWVSLMARIHDALAQSRHAQEAEFDQLLGVEAAQEQIDDVRQWWDQIDQFRQEADRFIDDVNRREMPLVHATAALPGGAAGRANTSYHSEY